MADAANEGNEPQETSPPTLRRDESPRRQQRDQEEVVGDGVVLYIR